MYLFSELQFIPLLVLFFVWGLGGWLLTLRWFELETHERALIGLGLGLILANWSGNFLARFLPLPLAFWVSAFLVLGLGIYAARPLDRMVFPGEPKTYWHIWLAVVPTVLIFTWIGRGLGMLDDFQNLPTVSLMATGDIPPHLPGDPDLRYGYHYFLILLGVQFMRVASAPPWTALDLARGLTLTLSIFLVGLLAWRLTRNKTVAIISAAFYALASGARWLLLLLPGTILSRVSSAVTLIGSGSITAPNLAEGLARYWEVAGSGPIPFPFAFVNGVNPAAIMAHHGYGVSANLILLLLLLLAGQRRTWKAGIPLTVLLASLALANEVDFVLLYLGVLLVAALWLIRNKTVRPPYSARFWIVVIFMAGILALVQGGLITEVLRGRLASEAQPDSYFQVGFSIVSPTVISSHLGKLSLFHPWQFLAGIFEIGPLVLALPLVLAWGYKAFREEQWFTAALVASTIPSLLSVLIEYSGNAGVTATTRLLSNLFFVCKILAVPLVWSWLRDQPEWRHNLAYALGAVTGLSGAVLLALQLVAIPRPTYTDFISDMDARFYEKYWNRLSPPTAWVLDPSSSRAPTIFGRQAESLVNWGVNQPEYMALLEEPDPYRLNAAGYSYIYADKEYWKQHDAQLNQPCVVILDTVEGVDQRRAGLTPDFRQLADISQCKN